MKRRLTYFAVIAVLADALVLGAVWQISPALSLTVALAVPAIEPMLASLYDEPRRERTSRADVYFPARPRAGLVLVRDTDEDVDALARSLARRNIAVVVPRDVEARALADEYARTLGVPMRIASAAEFRQREGAHSPATRAAYARHLFALVGSLLTGR
jgi:hypothetical protein